MKKIDAAIIGAGHNGLTAAFYLARAGLDVHLFERRPFIGGATITEELFPGFRFSTCAHMVHGIHARITRDMELNRRGLACHPCQERVMLRPDGTYFADAGCDSDRNLSLERYYSEEERAANRRYQWFTRTLCRMFEPYRLGPPPSLEQVRQDVAGTDAAEVLEQAVSLRISQLHTRMLPTPRLRARYCGDGKSVARNPLALHLAYFSISLPDGATGEAQYNGYPHGGMVSVSRTMCQAAVEQGAVIHVNSPVRRIIVEDGAVAGIELEDGTRIEASLVVSNLDPKRTFLRLLDADVLDGRFRRRVGDLKTQVSCMKLLAAVRELPRWKQWDCDPDRPHQGNLVLGMTPELLDAAWDDMDARRPPRMPVINFAIPSFFDRSLVDGQGHTASIWIYPAPAQLAQGTWDGVRDAVAQNIIDRISEYAPNFRDSIIDYRFRTPLDLERENGLTDGSIWHVQHEGQQLFWNRPLPELAHYRAPIERLYLCGAGQHPGGEVSGVPGHNAAQQVLADWLAPASR